MREWNRLVVGAFRPDLKLPWERSLSRAQLKRLLWVQMPATAKAGIAVSADEVAHASEPR
jgi:hypothetical protein